jgi:hypothetical protein
MKNFGDIKMHGATIKKTRKPNVGSLFFFGKSCFYEIMWRNIVNPDMPQVIYRALRFPPVCYK